MKDSPSCEKIIEEEPKTEWTSIIIASIITLFCTLQFTIYFTSLWPYLLQLDPTISETFFGMINAIYALCQAIMCPVFGYFAKKMGQNRLPILIGISIMIVGNIIFLCCPLTTIPARWVIFLSRLVIGTGAGVITVLRNYAVLASTPKDRARAISLSMGPHCLGLALGPCIQFIFVPLGYPGFQLIGHLSLDMYTAPTCAAIFLNIMGLLLVLFVFRESTVGIQQKTESDEKLERFHALPSYDKLPIAICFLSRYTQMFIITNLETIGPPLSMSMFNWNKKEAVFYNSLINLAFFIGEMMVFVVDVGFNLCSRIGNLVGFILIVLFHLLTFSWWWLPGKMEYQQEYIETNGTKVLNTEPVGCRSTFQWCEDVPPVNMWMFIISYVVIAGPAFGITTICTTTVFSHIIGPRDQGTLTGLFLLCGCVARIAGPLVVTSLFQLYGPRPAWAIEIFTAALCVILWAVYYKRMVPLKTAEKYGVGERIEEEPKTEWTSIIIASTIMLFCTLQFTIYFTSLWPYLLQLDPSISESFFGMINAVYALSQAIMCPVFGYFAKVIGQNRLPILIGISIMIMGNVIFLCCPLTTIPARWVIFMSKLVIGTGAGVITVLRNYAVVASTPKDRARAISMSMGPHCLGLALGPCIQFIFLPLGYPGFNLIGGLSLDMIGPPLSMTMFKWNKKEAVFYNSLIGLAFFIGETMVFVVDVGFNLCTRLNQRIGNIVGYLLIVLFHLLTFSWWWLPGKIEYQQEYIDVNGTTMLNPEPVGCRPSFEWCKDVPPVNMWIFIISYVIIAGPAIGVTTICTNTVFSQVIGPRDQGTLTGLLLLCGCVASIAGPVFVTSLFQLYGPRPAWVIETFTAILCVFLWSVYYKRMVPLKTSENYGPGERYRNKYGIVYKF